MSTIIANKCYFPDIFNTCMRGSDPSKDILIVEGTGIISKIARKENLSTITVGTPFN